MSATATQSVLTARKEQVTPSPSTHSRSRISTIDEYEANPFVMPPESDIFVLREKERLQAKQDRIRQRSMKVHEKSTYASRMNAKGTSFRQRIQTPEKNTAQKGEIGEDTQFILTTTKDQRIEKEDINSYIAKKREMFLVQYSLGVKRDEISKLEEIAKAEEQKLVTAEKYLEDSATMFDDFLKENDKNSVEAIKKSEAATKAKLDKVAEIKRINAQIMAIRSEISRNEDQLSELLLYKDFLDSLAPPEWIDERDRRNQTRQRVNSRLSNRALKSPSVTGEFTTRSPTVTIQVASQDGETDDFIEDMTELYFTDPQQLLDIFSELEEQNLSLIQNSQETEETLEEMRQTRAMTEQRLNKETASLKRQIESLQAAIEREEEKGNDLEIKSKMFYYGEFKAEDQEMMLDALNKKVTEVYHKCIGGNEASINTLQMLTNIENRLEELFEEIESLPPEKVEAAEKAKEKERRLRQREEKLAEQRLHQEERLRRALERAQADPKKRMGRKLVYRSEPPMLKRKQQDAANKKDKEEEELQYYFT
ncbi:cilia- and flagella-associated protein 100-like [Dysidea avara]|uniref:cilia- and flagella-associated protein 100-like n=1 Tax=Dysidea avara TaxID=196820 RepID=UPI0033167144